MKNALIYCFTYDGHRQVYAQYFIEVLLKRDYCVYLVSDLSEAEVDYPHLSAYHSNPLIKFRWIPKARSISLRDFRQLQDDNHVDLTILLEADDHLGLLSQQALPGYPRLRSKNIGVFIRSTNYIHKFRWLPNLGKLFLHILGHARKFVTQFRSFWINDPVIFHEVSLPNFQLLDAALTPDEVFVNARSNSFRYQWFPDIIFPILPNDPDMTEAELLLWQSPLRRFLDANQDRDVLLYFGLATRYKGYDTLLKLASEENCCFVHCGLFDPGSQYDEDVDELRNKLKLAGLLFETNTYIRSFAAVRLFFEACNYMVLPYRRHLGSSGVMLQSVYFGKPVLVPDSGLMAERTRRLHLGLIYRAGNEQDLKLKWKMMRKNLHGFVADLNQYKQAFVPEDIQHTLGNILSTLE